MCSRRSIGGANSSSHTSSRMVLWGHQRQLGIGKTASEIDHTPREISPYFMESTGRERPSYLRRSDAARGRLRIVSLAAALSGGDVVTKPLAFQGQCMILNYSTSAAGSICVEIQDASNERCRALHWWIVRSSYGDSLEQAVVWKSNPDLGRLAGRFLPPKSFFGDSRDSRGCE
jgi:hypothetical protein